MAELRQGRRFADAEQGKELLLDTDTTNQGTDQGRRFYRLSHWQRIITWRKRGPVLSYNLAWPPVWFWR